MQMGWLELSPGTESPKLCPQPGRTRRSGWVAFTQRVGMSGVKQRRGARGEDWAEQVLSEAGMFVIDRNWRCREGEIDLIAIDEVDGESTLVFCEVKYRTGTGFGTPLEAITADKVRRLRRAVARWLTERQVTTPRIRLDAIGLLDVPGQEIRITHVRGIE